MPGHRPYSELRAKMSPAAQQKAREGAAHDSAKLSLAEMELAELREQAQVTQVEMAARLKSAQTAVSRFERQRDWKLSSLVEYVKALGGRLELRAIFRDRSIVLSHLTETAGSKSRPRGTSHRRAPRPAR